MTRIPGSWRIAVSVGGRRAASAALAVAAALAATCAWADVVHFVNGDRLTGTLTEAPPGFVAIDVPRVGIVTVPDARVASVETDAAAGESVDIASTAATAAPAAAARAATETASGWRAEADFGMVVATGNTRLEDANLVLGAKRSGERFDNVFGVAVRKSAARGSGQSRMTRTRDLVDLDYDLRWKFHDSWYAVASLEYFRDPIKRIGQRYTAGAGVGHTFWQSASGTLSTDASVSHVFEDIVPQGVGPDGAHRNPALRWSLVFNRWLVADRIEVFHNNQLLRILASERGMVWDSDTGVRLHLNSRWRAGLRVDLQHEKMPPTSRSRTDATYAVALGVKL